MPPINDSKCVLVVGATSGIGRALAQSIKSLPSSPSVIVTGRRQERLQELAKEGFEAVQFDVDTDRATLKKFVDEVISKHPDLDAVIFCAGIQREIWFEKPNAIDLDGFSSELNTNYTSIVNMVTFILPHFLELSSQGRPTFIMPVTSGLSIVPAPWIPNYSATKAALHSFSMSLYAQLKDTCVHVMEIIPPLVESELHDFEGTTEKLSKFWMPLDVYTKQTMDGLKEGRVQVHVGLDDPFKRHEEGKLEGAIAYLAVGRKL